MHIRDAVKYILLSWGLLLFLITFFTFTRDTRLFVRYIKYSNPQNEMNLKIFQMVSLKFEHTIECQNFQDDIGKLMMDELNKYYKQFFF